MYLFPSAFLLLIFVPPKVASSLPNSLLLPLPHATSHILRAYGYLSWANLQALPLKCMSHLLNVGVDYHNSMELATVVPLLTLLLLFAVYLCHVEALYLVKKTKEFKAMQKQVSIRYGTLICVYLYVVAGGVHSLLFGSFRCVDADPDHQVPGRQYVLR